MIIFTLLLVWFYSRLCRGQIQECFGIDGILASDDFPCDANANVSARIDAAVLVIS